MRTYVREDLLENRIWEEPRRCVQPPASTSREGRRGMVRVNLSLDGIVLQLRSGTDVLEEFHDVGESQLVQVEGRPQARCSTKGSAVPRK